MFQNPSPGLVLHAVIVMGVAAELRLQTGSGAMQGAQLCLSRVQQLPKAAGYSALCTSIENLWQQQQTASSSFVALQTEGEQTRTSLEALERRNEELQARFDEREQYHQARIAELKQYEIKREKEWHVAAKKFQAGVAARDGEWQTTVGRLEAAAQQRLEEGLAKRDAHWQASVQRLEQQVLESQQQKEAMEASTSAGTKSRRAILLALSREKQKSSHENKAVRGLMEQIKALQRENAQLVENAQPVDHTEGESSGSSSLLQENAQLVQLVKQLQGGA